MDQSVSNPLHKVGRAVARDGGPELSASGATAIKRLARPTFPEAKTHHRGRPSDANERTLGATDRDQAGRW